MKNKQKRWRGLAAITKLQAIAAGGHKRGARYGRAIKAFLQAQTPIQAQPSNLFMWLLRSA